MYNMTPKTPHHVVIGRIRKAAALIVVSVVAWFAYSLWTFVQLIVY